MLNILFCVGICESNFTYRSPFRCTARNRAGDSQKSVMIYVQQRPNAPSPAVLSVNPPYPIIKEGESLTLVCSADQDIPTSSITWER